ncbi:MAG: YkuS family protein [Clostridiaceae bacterium]|nr:YkuS family protein [Clostridiaceae bacterium]
MVFMVVAVLNSLNHIKKELSERGYEVVDVEKYNYPIDAIIYEGDSFRISHISNNNMPEPVMGLRSNYGVFIINSSGKSIAEIEDMLRTRYYSPLF